MQLSVLSIFSFDFGKEKNGQKFGTPNRKKKKKNCSPSGAAKKCFGRLAPLAIRIFFFFAAGAKPATFFLRMPTCKAGNRRRKDGEAKNRQHNFAATNAALNCKRSHSQSPQSKTCKTNWKRLKSLSYRLGCKNFPEKSLQANKKCSRLRTNFGKHRPISANFLLQQKHLATAFFLLRSTSLVQTW